MEIVQPSIPHYRVPLFAAVAQDSECEVTVHASREGAGGPPSGSLDGCGRNIEHVLLTYLSGKILWQKGIRLSPHFGPGDVLVIAGNPRFLSNIPLVLSAKKRGGGIVWWGHGWSPTSLPWRARVRQAMMGLADVTLLYADQEIPEVRCKSSPDKLITATNNTLDPSRALAAQREWSSTRLNEFAASESVVSQDVVLFCGRLRRQPPSDLESAIRGLARTQTTDRKFLLAVIGSGDAEPELRALAAKEGVSNRIRWLGPIYEETKLAPWFLISKCFLYPGSIGLSLLHAFSYGLPVVTHDQIRFHNPEIHALRNGVNGKLFRKDDPIDLWRTIAEICSNDTARQRMAEAARRTALEEWSFEKMVCRFVTAVKTASEISRKRHGVGRLRTAT